MEQEPNSVDDPLVHKRHSAAHLLAATVLEMYPGTKFGMGPTIDDGFYYDFEFPVGTAVSEKDLPKIQKRLKKKIQQKTEFVGEPLSHKKAQSLFKDQPYKLELMNDITERGEEASLWTSGDFSDICKGGHVETSKEIPIDGLKLHRIAGAYWKGDEKNPMLTRIYGLLFSTKDELDTYIERVEDAKNRDHRKLGKELDLFMFADLVGKGLPMFTERGATIRRELERAIVDEEIRRGYKHVHTPDLANVDLYRTSGHYPYYKDTMYSPIAVDDEEIILRPMSCPHHFMMYQHKPHSYKELPIRLGELAKLYRYEKSGELTGLMRVRGFCLADAHIFATEDQAKDEIIGVLDLIEYFAHIFGLKRGEDYSFRLSLGDRNNEEKYYKNDEKWDVGEETLRQALKDLKAPFIEVEDEAAFYGPKIDVQMRNVLGKEDTAFTVQYDFYLPERFEIAYIDEEGKEQRPVVIHRSSIGAIERTMAFLIEHYAGEFPLWLSPSHVAILSVGESHKQYCEELATMLTNESIRVDLDVSDETVGNKIRKNVKLKTPYILVIGDKEMGSKDLMVRKRGEDSAVQVNKEDFITGLKKRISEKALDL
ncbi:MAG: threonine--tRNA ligase [Candidatus Kerfeldbacteria bacterium]